METEQDVKGGGLQRGRRIAKCKKAKVEAKPEMRSTAYPRIRGGVRRDEKQQWRSKAGNVVGKKLERPRKLTAAGKLAGPRRGFGEGYKLKKWFYSQCRSEGFPAAEDPKKQKPPAETRTGGSKVFHRMIISVKSRFKTSLNGTNERFPA